MNLATSFALSTYYHLTLPWRAWYARRARAARRAPVMVLFYHRVADEGLNPWTCTRNEFRAHLDWLARHVDLVSLAEAQRRIRSGENDRPAVSITFGDGYADNSDFALPLLVERRIPCTYFVATRFVRDQIPFPHDLARGQRLAPNSWSQLRDAAAAGIEIGAHTCNHVDLGAIHDSQRLHEEVVRGSEELQQSLGRPVRYFAFPFGQPANLNAAVFQLAFEVGFEAVCSAYGGYNWPGGDAFHLRRIHGDRELLRLKNWLTVDPRKLGVPHFDYDRHADDVSTEAHEPDQSTPVKS